MIAPRYVIVGSGIAGLAAAETIRQRASGADIVMIGEEPHPFYSRPGLAYLLRGDIPEKQLWIRRPEDLAALKLQRVHSLVENLDFDRHEAILAGGHRLGYDRLLIATGARAVPPPFLPEPIPGTFKLDSLDDARELLSAAKRGETAVVAGGGITALEIAEGLLARKMKVHYFLRGDRYWSDVLDEIESKIVMNRLTHEGMIIHTNTQIKEVMTTRDRVSGVETQDGKLIRCHLLAAAIGVRPRIDLAKKAGLEVDRGIVVDDRLRTGKPNVFAAGDVAQIRASDGTLGSLDVLWPTALTQGRLAGENMTGGKRPYAKGSPFNVTQLAGLKVTIIGAVGDGKTKDLVAIARGDSETWRFGAKSWAVSDRDDVNRVRLMVGDTTIVGALVMGDQTWSRPLQRLISEKVPIAPIRDALEAGGAAALSCLAQFYQKWEQSQAKKRSATPS